MTHYIAIIKTHDRHYNDYDDCYTKIVDQITDWTEVTDDEYKALFEVKSRLGYEILERPTDIKEFIAKTVSDYLAFAKAEEKRMAEEKAEKEKAALERKFKKDLKDKASKIKMLKKLQEELGPDAT